MNEVPTPDEIERVEEWQRQCHRKSQIDRLLRNYEHKVSGMTYCDIKIDDTWSKLELMCAIVAASEHGEYLTCEKVARHD